MRGVDIFRLRPVNKFRYRARMNEKTALLIFHCLRPTDAVLRAYKGLAWKPIEKVCTVGHRKVY